ncbi:LVIVD repeat-containing protein [Urechidicola croceus]|uniref:LVIVD repeat-containing protein n=1 Tax=Urechidicola croceus TaxID=1850246 RepID=A0A1D8PAU7_9FLAO|nr:hypothetical protein [Urechidicola croceus]AOW21675.1 hypothetical protein LPB138_13735 [Urechidicola croceus]
MKTKYLAVLLLLNVFFTSCDGDNYEIINLATPEVMDMETFRSSVEITTPIDIIESGKIYAYNNLVLINDIDSGIHIIDNSDPSHPVKKSFIKIIANRDMEIKENYLYADSLMDLLVFDISDINNIHEVSRLENVFPEYLNPPTVDNLVVDYGEFYFGNDEVIVGWTISQERRKVVEASGPIVNDTFLNAGESVGQGGSLARFKIIEDHLYAVDNHNINIFNINNLESPVELEEVPVGFGIETIFNRGNHLFLGSTNGMFVYDISSLATPEYVSQFTHATACDPVVVDGDYAYITLRGGNACGAFESSLEIVDINDINNPFLVKTYPMDNPYGLGLKNDLLFICDGDSGLKVYNRENVEDLDLLNTFENVIAYDVIPMENHLLMIGGNKLVQYNYSDNGLELLSQFSLN